MRDTIRRARLNNLLAEACKGGGLDDEEVRFLLGLTADEDLERLFQAARDLRQVVFVTEFFLRVHLFFDFCRNDCQLLPFPPIEPRAPSISEDN